MIGEAEAGVAVAERDTKTHHAAIISIAVQASQKSGIIVIKIQDTAAERSACLRLKQQQHN